MTKLFFYVCFRSFFVYVFIYDVLLRPLCILGKRNMVAASWSVIVTYWLEEHQGVVRRASGCDIYIYINDKYPFPAFTMLTPSSIAVGKV